MNTIDFIDQCIENEEVSRKWYEAHAADCERRIKELKAQRDHYALIESDRKAEATNA